MSKKWKDKTKGGHRIVHIIDGEHNTAGVVDNDGVLAGRTWDVRGSTLFYGSEYDLVPAEPEVEYRLAELKFAAGQAHIYAGTRRPNIKLGFNAETGELLTAEVLK